MFFLRSSNSHTKKISSHAFVSIAMEKNLQKVRENQETLMDWSSKKGLDLSGM